MTNIFSIKEVILIKILAKSLTHKILEKYNVSLTSLLEPSSLISLEPSSENLDLNMKFGFTIILGKIFFFNSQFSICETEMSVFFIGDDKDNDLATLNYRIARNIK